MNVAFDHKEYIFNKYPNFDFHMKSALIKLAKYLPFNKDELDYYVPYRFIFGIYLEVSHVHTLSENSPDNSDTIAVNLGIINEFSEAWLTQNRIIWLEDTMSKYLTDHYKKRIHIKFTVKNFLDVFELLKINLEDMFKMKSLEGVLSYYNVLDFFYYEYDADDSNFYGELDREFIEQKLVERNKDNPYFTYLLMELDVIRLNREGNKLFLTKFKQEVDINYLVTINNSLTQTLQLLCMSLVKPESNVTTPPIYSQNKESKFIEWKGHYFRSPQELEIAKELDSRQILFFPNAGCRVLEEKGMHTREIDFLVIIEGNMGILECDSDRYHQSAAKDHKRDSLFNAHGIWFIRRYTSQDCQNPEKVVDGFISDFKKFIKHKN